jgi:microcystin degradation protein MlrC
MRIGILALLHESNSFVTQPTTLERFREDLYLQGPEIADRLANSHHEVGGFFEGLRRANDSSPVTAVPLVAFRATPSGPITADAFDHLLGRVVRSIEQSGPLDGLLIAAHGAAVTEADPDADGFWLAKVREIVGKETPIVGTLDPHANLSPAMVDACDALIAYRTNPHLDQRQRGDDAAGLIIAALRGEVRPRMSAAYPPMVINIERQCTSEPHLRAIYEIAERQLSRPGVLSNSILLGFPYADVAEMGAATIAISDDDPALAEELSGELADALWSARDTMVGRLIEVDQALDRCEAVAPKRVCLLDMGDNVGGGSAADGTVIAKALHHRKLGPSFICLYDPGGVERCHQAGVGNTVSIHLGGHTDGIHGDPIELSVRPLRFHDGRFQESQPRHGGITHFDQGETVVAESIDSPLTLMLTSKRMVPFSLQQLLSCGLDPSAFRILVAKGVHAPLAAYREACDVFLRVNTPGSTCADLNRLTFQHRRKPLFPFE